MTTNIDQVSRIVNMFSKKQFDDYIEKTGIEASDEASLISELKKPINIQEYNQLLLDYQYVFKPYNSCLIKFKRVDDPENKLMQNQLGDWTIVKCIDFVDKKYFLMEKNGASKKISTGWGFQNIQVKEVGIAVLYINLNLLEIRSNMIVQKKIAKVFEPYLLEPYSLEINRNYYIAILQELRAREFSVIWETEGELVTKARLDGKNINVKDGALITIPSNDSDNGEIQINLIEDANPKNVGSFIEDLDTKIHLSAQGHLKFTRLMKENEITDTIFKISSALSPLTESKNPNLDISNEDSILNIIIDFCKSTNDHILQRFSRRYFSFKNLLNSTDADIVINYLIEKDIIQSYYEFYDEDYNLLGKVNEEALYNPDLLPEECKEALELSLLNSYDLKPISKFYKVNSTYLKTLNLTIPLDVNEIVVDEGMNNKIFVDERVPEVIFDDLTWELKKRQLIMAISRNHKEEIDELAKEFAKHNRLDILEEFNVTV